MCDRVGTLQAAAALRAFHAASMRELATSASSQLRGGQAARRGMRDPRRADASPTDPLSAWTRGWTGDSVFKVVMSVF